MRKNALWIVLSFIIGISMLPASCKSSGVVQTSAALTTTSSIENETAPYGGTFAMLNNADGASSADPTGWDLMNSISFGQASVWGNPYLEKLLVGDIEKYGPRGDNSFSFDFFESVPDQYLVGLLAKSWEISTSPTVTYTFHLRQGIMFTGNQHIGMTPRELTSADVKYSEERARARPNYTLDDWLVSEDTPDKYTIVWHCSAYYANWSWVYNGVPMGQIWAHESVEAPGGANDWRDQVGTGPYILTDFVSGVGATYTRNPNYWGKTVMDGKTYQLPFIQTLVYPVIADESVQLADLRTGKIDWIPVVYVHDASDLSQGAPGLVQQKYLTGFCDYLSINRLNPAIFGNKDVRRALMIGTDLKSIADTVYGGGEYYSWPFAPGVPGYVPLAQLPADLQELWTYDSAKAKELLASAGYPDGFTMEIMVSSANSTQTNLANTLAVMYAKIGVTVKVNSLPPNMVTSNWVNANYKDTVIAQRIVVNPITTMNLAGSSRLYLPSPPDNLGMQLSTMYAQMTNTVDPAQRALKLQAMGQSFMGDVSTIGFANATAYNCYWPWFKNYYGELDASYYNAMPMITRGWIDRDLKKSLGY
jgi:peptide/nickel transport system substrate-binding protein